jgi:peptide/nickel transport system permease protein
MAQEAGSILVVPPKPIARRLIRMMWGFRRAPILPILCLGLVVFAGITAPWISPHDPTRGNLVDRNLPGFWSGDQTAVKLVVEEVEFGGDYKEISLEDAREVHPNAAFGDEVEVVVRRAGFPTYILGTDHLGRDLLSRTIYGARISLIMAVVTLGVGGTIGIALGLLAGWYGRLIDEIIMRLVDIELSLPLILVALVLVVSLGQSLTIIVAVLAIWIWPRFARMVRGEVLTLKTTDYVALARVSGASPLRIMFVHLFPGTINTLIVVATLQVGIVILVEASLSFLGAGVPPPEPAWGSMVADGRDRLADAWWIATIPGVAVLLTVMSLNLFGDWLRDKLDPRLRQIE